MVWCHIPDEKKSSLYVGKGTRRFLLDKDGLANALELDCLKPRVGNGTVLQSYDKSTERDLFIYPFITSLLVPLKLYRRNSPILMYQITKN